MTPTGPQISAPALECPSRICLLTPKHAACSVHCSQDSDCVADPKSVCAVGLACAPITDSGPFCCQKFCMCKEDVVSGLICPNASCPH